MSVGFSLLHCTIHIIYGVPASAALYLCSPGSLLRLYHAVSADINQTGVVVNSSASLFPDLSIV